MPHYSAAMRAELFKYRKRKNLSLYGSVPGSPSGRYIRGLHHATPPGSRSYGTGRPRQQSIYDSRGFYEWPDQGYKQSASWFDQRFPGTPPLRVQGTSRRPRPTVPDHDDGVLIPKVTDSLLDRFRALAAEQSLWPTEPPGNMGEILQAIQEAKAANVGNMGTIGAQGVVPHLESTPLNNSTLDESVGSFPSLPDLTDAFVQLSEVLPPDHPDLINLRWAVRERLGALDSWSQSENHGGPPAPLYSAANDPYAADPYEGAEQTLAPEATTEMNQEMIEQAIDQAIQPEMTPEPTAEQPDAFASMEAAYDQQFAGGLEGIVQEAMPEEDPFERQRRMYDEEMMMLMNPFMMPGGFGSGGFGPIGPGFGPMGPAPGM